VARLHGVIGVGGAGQAVADVTVRGGATVLYECHLGLAGQSDPTTLAVMPFTLDSDATDLECRVRVTDSSDVRIDLIEIHKDVGGWQAAQATATIQKWQVGGRGFRLWATHPSLHSAVGNRVDRTIWTSTQAGHILYGPYCTVRAGSYRASVFGEVNVKDSLGNSMMDLSANSGKLTFGWKRIADQVSVSDELVTIDFELTEFVDDFEIRVWADHGADFRITGVELRPTDEGVSAPEIELSADDVPRTVLSDA
jgi:hypothetical protein